MARSTSSLEKSENMVMLSRMEALKMKTFCCTTEIISYKSSLRISFSSAPSKRMLPE